MKKCPYCGSNEGVFVTFIGIQYYTWEGEPNGYSTDTVTESKFAKCVKCEHKILMNKILKS